MTLSDDSESFRQRKSFPKSKTTIDSQSNVSGESAVIDMFELENEKL